MRSLKKIISDGQTGVDQAALQAAIDSGFEHGGWCPPGRICESGKIPLHFDLRETPKKRDSSASDIPRSQRTIWNVRDSDGSLILSGKELTKLHNDKGTKLGLDTAKKLRKPYLIIDSKKEHIIPKIQKWIEVNNIENLSVGGPSEATSPGIYDLTYTILIKLFNKV